MACRSVTNGFFTGALVHYARFEVVALGYVILDAAPQVIINGMQSCRTMPGVLCQVYR